MAFDLQSSRGGAYSDFAHVNNQATLAYVLSLGNDGMDEEKLAMLKALARKRKKKKRAPTLTPEGEKIEVCRKLACLAFEKKMESTEELVLEEREKLTTTIQNVNTQLGQLEERLAEITNTKTILTERGLYIQGEIDERNKHCAALQKQQEDMLSENQMMTNGIMELEVEVQRRRIEAKQAQEDMIKAMWYKFQSSNSTSMPDLPPLDPLVTQGRRRAMTADDRKRRSVIRNASRYTGLVRSDLKDVIEVETVHTEPLYQPFAWSQSVAGSGTSLSRASMNGTLRGGRTFGNTLGGGGGSLTSPSATRRSAPARHFGLC